MAHWLWESDVSAACSRPEATQDHSRRWTHGLVCRAALALSLALACGCGRAPTRKLIEFGWDEPDTATLRRQIGRMEQMPFDGCVFHAVLSPPGGPPANLAWEFWGRRRFEHDDARQAREDLWKTPRRRFRHNLLRLNVTPGDVDWYEDFSPILANARLAAALARDGGCAGLLLDTEPYETPLFDYRRRPAAGRRTWDEYAAQARQRGRELMHAFEQGYPDVTVLVTFGHELPWLQSDRGQRPLADGAHGLLAPFLDGLIDGRRHGRLVNAFELSYGFREAAAFAEARTTVHEGVLPIVADPTRYRDGMALGFGLWLDFEWRARGWSSAVPESNYFTPEAFERSLHAALRASDEYVWIYSETPRWWTSEGGPRALPPAYIEAVWRARRAAGLD